MNSKDLIKRLSTKIPDKETHMLAVRLGKEQYKEFHKVCTNNKIGIADTVRLLIEEFLKNLKEIQP